MNGTEGRPETYLEIGQSLKYVEMTIKKRFPSINFFILFNIN